MAVTLPAQCASKQTHLDDLNFQLDQLQDSLGTAAPGDKPRIIKQILAKQVTIGIAEDELAACIVNFSIPVFKLAPLATVPNMSSDATLIPVKKNISWSLLQKKFDEFFNLRTEPHIFKVRFHHHDFIPPGQFTPDNDPPASHATISMIEAAVVNRQVTTEYNSISTTDFGQLDHGYYFDDIGSSSININIDPWQTEPLSVTINFETTGPVEIPSTSVLSPNLDLIEFSITLKLSFDVIRLAVAVPVLCIPLQEKLENATIQLLNLQEELAHASPTQKTEIIKKIVLAQTGLQNASDDLTTCISVNGGADPFENGRLEFLSWIDKIKDLHGDEYGEALGRYVVVKVITTSTIDPGGLFRQTMRNKIGEQLSDPAKRLSLNNTISKWILGGTGLYDVQSISKNEHGVTVNYLVPQNKLEPFPDSIFKPANWPGLTNPKPVGALDFSIPPALANIKHIVVLTMENRSFDHMLGYLSLPVSAGGMGRSDVNGLKGGEFNPYNADKFFSFPVAVEDTAFPHDPSHSYEPVFHQIDASVDDAGNGLPGTGTMYGFAKSFAEEAHGGNGPEIMGYQTGENVPVYDALARDFGISDGWFASHPGPTFANRFYELTGRLNLASGLNKNIAENSWEFSNSSPLTPVFTKTIFDHLTEYAKTVDQAVTWKYYEDHYCFLRFFSKYTFDNSNIVGIDDPVKGFFADAKNGTLPSVSYIDPHFIELPPNANCDGPVADIKAGQTLVQKVVEAVVTSPQYANTVLIITYDEHGGFYDHQAPPLAIAFSPESPIKTYGVRVPTLFVSPWIKAGAVFGNNGEKVGPLLQFDHTSILKTIARRFMSKNPPYMGARYAAANDLSVVMSQFLRKPLFLPFVRYNMVYVPGGMRLNIEGGNANGAVMGRFNANETEAQQFSFEQAGDFVYIRTNCGRKYLTVNVPNGGTTSPTEGFGIIQDGKYEGAHAVGDPDKFNSKYQLWKFTRADATPANEDLFIVVNAFFPNLVLRPADISQNAQPIVLAKKATNYAVPNTWLVGGPLTSP